jgi:outer membrane protein OmpA-like peptidoglycan-associated protein
MQGELTLEGDAAPVAEPPYVADSAVPDTMSQAKALGQEADGFVDDATETSSLNTGYVGGNTRLGIGIDSELKGKADVSQILHQGEGSATIGQGYVGFNPKAKKAKGEESLTGAGVTLNHHWVSTDEKGQATHVNKVFGAYDQNEQKDKKVTAGYGQENENLFWSGQVSKGLSDKRATGTAANGSTVFEKAYDYGVGGRIGKYLPDQQMRVQGGLDYEWGKDFANTEKRPAQATLSGGVEKFFPNTPHSIGADVEVYKKSGGYVEGNQKADARGGISYRYDIASDAGIWQANQQFRRVRVEIPGEEIKQPPAMGRKLVKHTMELEADTFFELDKAKLTPEANERLNAVIAQIRASGHEGNIRITGNTCDLGSDKHNLDLSKRRANAVRDFMANNGFSSDELLAEGLGESQPKYPNSKTERHKNRRVDIEYVNYQNEFKNEVIEEGGTTTTDPKVVWRKELIPTPPLWVRQALHSTIDHKQSVDTYKTTAGGANANAPVATDDQATTSSGTPVPVNVLGNDTDPNGDVLSIASFTQGSNGSVSQVDDNLVYTPTATFTGTDTFTYTINDPAGNQSAPATVTVTVNPVTPVGVAPIAADNDFPVDKGSVNNVLGILGNDTIPDGETVTIIITQPPTHGTLTMMDGYVEYTPDATYDTSDVFKYKIKSNTTGLESSEATVSLAPCPVCHGCPVDTSKTGGISYTFSNMTPDIKYINATDYVSAGTAIESVSFSASGSEPSKKLYATTVSGSPVYAGLLQVQADNTIKFTPSAGTYCKEGTFDFYIKLKDCPTPVKVTMTITEVG